MYKWAKLWFTTMILALIIMFVYFYLTSKLSLVSHFIVFIWLISGIGVLYRAKNSMNRGLTKKERYSLMLIGVTACVLSFICVDIGFCNSPYSIGEFSILLSGLTIIFFSCMSFRPLIIPGAFPLITVILYQIFDIFQENIDKLSEPFVKPTAELTAFILRTLGIAAETNINIITFQSTQGALIPIMIVPDCTGIWSLGAFTASLILVAIIFPRVFSRDALPFIAVGYVGTYIANISRVVIICLSAFYWGYSGTTQAVHMHAGWIAFSTWMITFWYVFFSMYLLKKETQSDEKSSDNRNISPK